jgi:uncharacterized protein (TIGR02391 family)
MNLQTHISAQLWAAIEGPYDVGNYSHAVLEAVHVVTNVLREKAGVDGDGAVLVGQALGGDNPRIRLNSLETDTERNVQRGIEQILRGIYTAIRNPRSHNAVEDEKATADAVIYFLSYILGLLDTSTEAFTIDAFWSRVIDQEFVDTARYAELLLSEIPPMRRGDAMMRLFQSRLKLPLRERRHVTRQLMAQMNEAQMTNYLAYVSAELRGIGDDASIRTALQMIKPEHWPRIGEVARLRMEQKLLKGIEEGEILLAGRGKTVNPLATWSRQFLPHFTARADAAEILVEKLEDSDADDRAYVARFFLRTLPEILLENGQIDRAVAALGTALRANDQEIRSSIIGAIPMFPQIWIDKLVAAVPDLTDPNNPAIILSGGVPFLSAPTAPEADDDIPF